MIKPLSSPARGKHRKGRGAPLLPLLSVNFIGTLGFSIVLPFLVFLVTRWGGNALVYGAIGATYSAFQLIGAPILGRLSDVHGRKKLLLLSQIGTVLSWLVLLAAFVIPSESLMSVDSGLLGSFTITAPLIVLFVARAADGLTGGNISVANAYLADISSEDERSVNFGRMAVSANLGFIAGPAIAGLFGGMGEIVPVVAALGISSVAAVIIAFKLPESLPRRLEADPGRCKVRKVFGQEHRECFKLKPERMSTREVLRLPGLPIMLAIYFLVMLGFNFFYVGFPAHAVGSLEWSLTETGIFFSVMGLLMVMVQGPVLGRLSRIFSDATLTLAGSLVLAGSFLFFGATGIVVIYLGVALLALGNGLMWPSILSIMSRMAGKKYQGAVQGIAGSAGAVASILGLVAGGILYEFLGARVFWISSSAILAVFLMAAMLVSRTAKTLPDLP